MRRRNLLPLIVLGGLVPFAALLWVILRPDAVDLRWQFRKGEVWHYQVTYQNRAIVNSCTYSMTVLEIDGKGAATIQCKCEAASTKSDQWNYDSRRDPKEPTHPVEAAFFARLDKTMTIRMNSLGYVSEVDGASTQTLGKQGSILLAMDLFQYPHYFSQDGSLVWYLPLPEKPIRPRDSWSLDLEVRGPAVPHEDQFRRTFRLADLTRDEARISIEDHFSQSRQDNFDKGNLKVERDVHAVFSVDQGRLLSFNFEERIRSGKSDFSMKELLEVKLISAGER